MRYDYKNPQLVRAREAPLAALLAQRGMVTHLARHLGISKAAVAQWYSIPAMHIPAIAKLLDIPQYQLREARTARPTGPKRRRAA